MDPACLAPAQGAATRGRLCTHVARPLASDAEGVDRARSATEAFLYRRLETLPQSQGRFRLNAVLLQENGYLVLRFLAQDVGKELDRVLDTILGALARGSRPRSSSGTS